MIWFILLPVVFGGIALLFSSAYFLIDNLFIGLIIGIIMAFIISMASSHCSFWSC